MAEKKEKKENLFEGNNNENALDEYGILSSFGLANTMGNMQMSMLNYFLEPDGGGYKFSFPGIGSFDNELSIGGNINMTGNTKATNNIIMTMSDDSPSPPAQNQVKLFNMKSATDPTRIQLIAMFPDGTIVVIAEGGNT